MVAKTVRSGAESIKKCLLGPRDNSLKSNVLLCALGHICSDKSLQKKLILNDTINHNCFLVINLWTGNTRTSDTCHIAFMQYHSTGAATFE